MNISLTQIDKQSKPNKITSIAEIKWQSLREERCNTRTTQRCVIEEETEALGVKPLRCPPSGKHPLKNVVGIHE